jgi:hypothetical protein
MSAFTRRRLERLQAKRKENSPCEECGHGLGLATYEVEFVDHSEPDEYCPKCGRQLSVEITWDADSEAGVRTPRG